MAIVALATELLSTVGKSWAIALSLFAPSVFIRQG
jgi:hypothetical protein